MVYRRVGNCEFLLLWHVGRSFDQCSSTLTGRIETIYSDRDLIIFPDRPRRQKNDSM